jgi:hypothetical protein
VSYLSSGELPLEEIKDLRFGGNVVLKGTNSGYFELWQKARRSPSGHGQEDEKASKEACQPLQELGAYA